MSIFERFFGGPKPEEKVTPETTEEKIDQGEGLPQVENDSDTSDGDEMLTGLHDFEAVLKEHPELRPDSVEKKEE